jgi:hypothetical protein
LRGKLRDDLEVNGVTADHAAKRHHAVIRAAFLLGRVERDDDRDGDFERTRHGDALNHRARFLQYLHRAGEQQIGNIVVIARFDDQNARAFGAAFLIFASPWPGHRCTPTRDRAH